MRFFATLGVVSYVVSAQLLPEITMQDFSQTDKFAPAYKAADTNNDNVLDLLEFELYFDLESGTGGDLFALYDTNNNNQLTIKEIVDFGGNTLLETVQFVEQPIDTDPSTVQPVGTILCGPGKLLEFLQCVDCPEGMFSGRFDTDCTPCYGSEYYKVNNAKDGCEYRGPGKQAPVVEIPGIFEAIIEVKLEWDTSSSIEGCDCITVSDCFDKTLGSGNVCRTLFCGDLEINPFRPNFGIGTYAPCNTGEKAPPAIAEKRLCRSGFAVLILY